MTCCWSVGNDTLMLYVSVRILFFFWVLALSLFLLSLILSARVLAEYSVETLETEMTVFSFF